MKQLSLFTDEQMALFGVRNAKSRRGRAADPRFNEAYGVVPKKTMYSVETIDWGYGTMFDRVFKMPMGSTGKFRISVAARKNDRKGVGFGIITLTDEKGNNHVFVEHAQIMRNMAQVLNAAANSCGATWRKSSFTP